MELVWLTIAGIAGLELLSWIAQGRPLIGTAACLVIVGFTFAAALRRLEFGLYILLAELFVGSHGHLLEATVAGGTMSLRIGLFLAVLTAWLWQRIRTKKIALFPRSVRYYYLALAIFLAVGLVRGLLRNDYGNVFFDFNAWLYFALAAAFIDAASPAFIKNSVKILLRQLQDVIIGSNKNKNG